MRLQKDSDKVLPSEVRQNNDLIVPKQIRWAETGRFYLASLIFIFATHLLANRDNISLHKRKWSRADLPPANSIHTYQTMGFPPLSPLPVLTDLASLFP